MTIAGRDESRAGAGKAFDIRAFHDTVLGAGSLPLSLLEKGMNEWMAGVKGSGAARE